MATGIIMAPPCVPWLTNAVTTERPDSLVPALAAYQPDLLPETVPL